MRVGSPELLGGRNKGLQLDDYLITPLDKLPYTRNQLKIIKHINICNPFN